MENENNIKEKESQEGQDLYPPFLGLFNMTRGQRILHASIISLIGSAFMAYHLWKMVYPGIDFAKSALEMSSWYVMPCFILSVFLLLSAFPVDLRTSLTRVIIQQILRCFIGIVWLFLYINGSQIFFILFYKYLPA